MPIQTAFSREEIRQKMIPVLEKQGAVYAKKKNVLARKASAGERIETVTGDGPETVNVAGADDYIVQNQTDAKEMYILSAGVFLSRYQPLGAPSADGFVEYRPTGRILAIELTLANLSALDLPPEFRFTADWGEDMVAKAGDFIGCLDDFSSVYRLARKEFFETYDLWGNTDFERTRILREHGF
jgi:hypothetical protein